MNESAIGALSAFLSSVTWACGTTVYSVLSREYSAFTVNFTRALVALPLFLAAAILTFGPADALQAYRDLPALNISWYALSMICSYGIGDLLFLSSARSMGVPGALAVSSISPIWAVLVGAALKAEIPSLTQSIGVLVTLAGVVGVIMAGARLQKSTAQPGAVSMRGPILALFTSMFWGVNIYAVGQGGMGVSPLVGNSVRMIFALIITSLLWKKFGPQSCPLVLPWRRLKSNLALFAVEAFGGSLFFMYGLAHSPVVLGATLASLAPVVAVPIAWVLGTERPDFLKFLAVATTVLGVWLLFV